MSIVGHAPDDDDKDDDDNNIASYLERQKGKPFDNTGRGSNRNALAY